MRAARQLAERRDAVLGATAIGAEQVPLHGEKTGPHAGEAGLDGDALRDAELAAPGAWAERIRSLAMPVSTMVGERLAEPIAVGAAIDPCRRAPPRARARPRAARAAAGRSKSRARPWRRRRPASMRLSTAVARLARQPLAEQPARSRSAAPIRAHSSPWPRRRPESSGSRSNTGPKRRNGPLVKTRAWRKWRLDDPLVRLLLPFEREARRLAAAAAQHRAVGCGVSSSA